MIDADVLIAATIAAEVPPLDSPGFDTIARDRALQAVAEVIRNRVLDPRYPDTAVEVVYQPRQFSCVGSPYWVRALAGRWFPAHVERALLVWRRRWTDTLPGVLHYYSPISMDPQGAEPAWLAGLRELYLPGVDPWWFRWFT